MSAAHTMTLHTDINPFCCAVLRARVGDGSLPPADVLCGDVRALDAAALEGYRHINLFAGIGGSALGLAWAGWPGDLSIVTGGFPCQDISVAGKGAGLDGERSGLFWEMLRVVNVKQPDWVLVENVGALSTRGLDRVAGAMDSLGYGVCSLRLGAWAVGSPHGRERYWIVAHALRGGRKPGPKVECDAPKAGLVCERVAGDGGACDQLADAAGRRCGAVGMDSGPRPDGHQRGAGGQMGDAVRGGRGAVGSGKLQPVGHEGGAGGAVGHADGLRLQGLRQDPGPPQVAKSGHASTPGRWPHPRWEDQHGDTLPTPQYDWEPPRIYPGTSTVSAEWRLSLMGFPPGWLDLDEARVEEMSRLNGPGKRVKRGRWWNKQGVIATGNSQAPQCVAVVARAMLDAAADTSRETTKGAS